MNEKKLNERKEKNDVRERNKYKKIHAVVQREEKLDKEENGNAGESE